MVQSLFPTTLPAPVAEAFLRAHASRIPVEWTFIPEGARDAERIIHDPHDSLIYGDAVYYAAVHFVYPYDKEKKAYGTFAVKADIFVTVEPVLDRPVYRIPEQLLRDADRNHGWVTLDKASLRLRDLREMGLSASHSLSAMDADLRGSDLRGLRLVGAELHDAQLQGALLRRADLSDAYLNDADLLLADLTGADLSGAYLLDADLMGADLRGANLRDVNLQGANVAGAHLTGANLTGVKVAGAELTGAKLEGVIFSRDVSDIDTDW